MERLPSDILPEYYASSIADFLNNEGEIRQDTELAWKRRHWTGKTLFWLGYGAEVAELLLARADWQIPADVHVEIPSVSHLPARDRSEVGRSLTIYDQTDEMELVVMSGSFRREGINPDSVKQYSWHNKHVTLFLDYHVNPERTRRYLINVESYLAPATAVLDTREFRRNIPVLNPQGMVN